MLAGWCTAHWCTRSSGCVVADVAVLRGFGIDVRRRALLRVLLLHDGGSVVVVVEVVKVDVDEGVEWVEDGVFELKHFCAGDGGTEERSCWSGGEMKGVGPGSRATGREKRENIKYADVRIETCEL